MESEKKNYCSKYLKVVMAVLLAAALFYSGMKDYVKVGKTDTAVVELYGDYPAVNLAKQIWENYQSSDEITDFCFVWNGGVQVVTNPEDFRQTNARVQLPETAHPILPTPVFPGFGYFPAHSPTLHESYLHFSAPAPHTQVHNNHYTRYQ